MSDSSNHFFGLEVLAPWPETFPRGCISEPDFPFFVPLDCVKASGIENHKQAQRHKKWEVRFLDAEHRHITLAFLGRVSTEAILPIAEKIPLPTFQVGLSGKFDSPLFLPPRRPHVVAWHPIFFEQTEEIHRYQKNLVGWLNQQEGIHVDDRRDFLPHTTIARGHIDQKMWIKAFHPLPFIATALHLYKSMGQLKYEPIWSQRWLPPFESIDHTADVAFKIRGTNLQELHLHALTALAFEFPPLVDFFKLEGSFQSLDEVICSLNEAVTQVDIAIGSPFKAVSLHGEIQKNEHNVLEWEMIVDV